jgi:hypothetical protein
MTLFILGKAWLFAVVAGLIFLLRKDSRFVSAYLLLGSTVGLVLSFVGVALMSSILGPVSPGAPWEPVAMVAGGVLGAFIGFWMALKVNRLLGWQIT